MSDLSTGWTDPNDQYAKDAEEMRGGKPVGPRNDDSFPYLHVFDDYERPVTVDEG